MKIHNDIEQNSDQWLALRAGKPTASAFSNLITSTGTASKSLPNYAITLAGELYAGKPLDAFEGNSWTERGHDLEDNARAKYEMLNDIDAIQIGFVTDDKETHGCSPDSLVGDNGLLEIKCLKAENHIKAIMYHQKHGKMPTTYVQQTQGQMMVCERDWCDLVFYHPDLPMLTIRSEPDTKIIHGLKQGIADVIAERDEVLEKLAEIAA